MKVIKAEDTRSLEPFRDRIIEGDCLEVMKGIPGESIDMILCDLPYGTTQNKWDSIIDLDLLFTEYMRIAESDRVALEPNFPKLVGHPASDKEIRINRGNHRCENALHLMFTSTTALDSTAGSSRHTRLSCMLTFLENTGSHNRLLSMVQNIPVRIRCNESMCRRT